MIWVYDFRVWLSALTAVFLLGLAAYSWSRRSVPGAPWLAVSCLLAVLWVGSSILGYTAVDTGARVFWSKFQLIWQLPVVTAVTCFILEYAWPGRWLKRRNLALLSIVPLLVIVLVLTNNSHHLVWQSLTHEGMPKVERNLAIWSFLVYALTLILLEFIVSIWLFIRSPQHRWPVFILIIGLILATAVYLGEVFDMFLIATPVGVLANGLVFLSYAVALFGFHLLDPTALARGRVIEQLQTGMLVLDPQGRIASLNPAAERILGMPSSHTRRSRLGELLPAYPGGRAAGPSETEISLGEGENMRHYMLSDTPLNDWRGLEVGLLVMLSDVTEQKKAQAQILEQQRALATLGERERMARELHDSLGQVLGYAGFQAGAAARLIRKGKPEAALPLLTRLDGVIQEAHADVREYILNLRSAPALDQPFFATLQQYLESFASNHDIRTLLEVGPGVNDGTFAPDVQLQILRIIQEALSNARKHGHAQLVQVAFAAEEGRFRMSVADDGRGFVPGSPDTVGGQHFGLKFMQERAAQIGAELRIQSAPGAGTRVMLEISN